MLVGGGDDAGFVPMNAGLSSSSALVVASALATMRASGACVDQVSMMKLHNRFLLKFYK